ncbi:MAG: hypothetical protein GC156_16470 [Actinomycetales bacterium]|nr:hypothetical protein [Actinomycetales bacterium]
MLKRIAATTGVAVFLFGAGAGVAHAADHGNAWGKKAGDCVAALDLSLGQAIQAGRAAHGAVFAPQQIAESVHCTS